MVQRNQNPNPVTLKIHSTLLITYTSEQHFPKCAVHMIGGTRNICRWDTNEFILYEQLGMSVSGRGKYVRDTSNPCDVALTA